MSGLDNFIRDGYKLPDTIVHDAVPTPSAGPLWKTIQAGRGCDLMSMEFPPIVYAVEDLITEGCSILAGPRKVGKSWLSLQLCLAIANGTPLLGRHVEQGEALYCAFEDPPRRLQDRLSKLGEPMGTDFYYLCRDKLLTINNGLVDFLDAWCTAHTRARVIVIDVLAMVWHSNKRNQDAYTEAYDVIGRFKKLGEQHHVAVILVHHVRKKSRDDGDDPFDRILGSTGIVAAADTSLVLERSPASVHGKLSVIGRDVPSDEIPVAYERCRWRLSSILEDDGNDDIRKLVRGLAASSPAGWIGTPSQAVAQAGEFGARVTSPESVGWFFKNGYCADVSIRRRTRTSRDYIIKALAPDSDHRLEDQPHEQIEADI